MTQDPRVKRLLVVSVILIFICIVCIFVSVRYVEKYRNQATETAALEQKLDSFEQNVKKLDIKIKELEARRYDLSLEKKQITKDYSIIKDKYVFLGKMIKALEGDVGTLQRAIKTSEEIEEESGEADSELKILQNRNDKLLKELAKKTKEKMILEIAFEAQAKRLGLAERHDPGLKETIKDFVTSLQ